MQSRPELAVLLLAATLLVGAAPPAARDKLAEPLALARLVPVRWQDLRLLTEKEYGYRKIAQLEISFARADYVSADHGAEASFEVIDTLHSPMHLNEFEFDRTSVPADRVTRLGLPYGEGYIVQDLGEEQSRTRLLFKDRYLVKIDQSPPAEPAALVQLIQAWMNLPDVRSFLK
jgi:hypothetical protein